MWALHERSETNAIPVMAITAHPPRYQSAEVLAAGCAAYLIKPVNTRSLRDQLRALLSPAHGSPS
jgi:DNA-binding response OmpR family regulator